MEPNEYVVSSDTKGSPLSAKDIYFTDKPNTRKLVPNKKGICHVERSKSGVYELEDVELNSDPNEFIDGKEQNSSKVESNKTKKYIIMILIGVAVGTLITGGACFAVYKMIGTKDGKLMVYQILKIYTF